MLVNKYIIWMSVFILSTLSDSVSCQDSCTVKADKFDYSGRCVLIDLCPYIRNLVKTRTIGKDIQCGFEKDTPKVCCPIENSFVYVESEPTATNSPKEITTPKSVILYSNENEVAPLNETSSTYTLPNRTVCGQYTSDDRIYGGDNAAIDEFPWLARIKCLYKDQERYICGGSLITNRHVLTAAHCVLKVQITSVRLGEFDTNTEHDCYGNICSGKALDVPVEKVISYPEYSTKQYTNGDIALLKLSHSVAFTDFIQPICLPTTEYTAAQDYVQDSMYVTAGWGLTESGFTSPIKRKVMLKAVPIEICQIALKTVPSSSIPYIICAGGRKGQDSCRGDSGGPLVREVSEDYQTNWYLYGITSFGYKNCGTEGVPGMYTRVTAFIDWIRKEVATA